MGAWIETQSLYQLPHFQRVAPYVGAWIETKANLNKFCCARSHPMWVRGLKPSPYAVRLYAIVVAPYVGAWIETAYLFLIGVVS